MHRLIGNFKIITRKIDEKILENDVLKEMIERTGRERKLNDIDHWTQKLQRWIESVEKTRKNLKRELFASLQLPDRYLYYFLYRVCHI